MPIAAVVSTVLCGGLMSISVFSDTAHIASSWNNAASAIMQAVDEGETTWKSWYQPFCTPSQAIVEGSNFQEEREVCYVASNNARLGVYTDPGSSYPFYALQRSDDEIYHRLTSLNPNPSHLVLLKNNTVLGASLASMTPLAMYSLNDFFIHAVPTQIPSGPTTYHEVYALNTNSADAFIDSDGNTIPVGYIAVSNNEHYAVAQAMGRGIIRVDLSTREVKLIAHENFNDSSTILAISDDGDTIAAIASNASQYRVYSNINACGSTDTASSLPGWSHCFYTDLSSALADESSDAKYYNPSFSSDGSQFIVHSWDESNQHSRKLTFTSDPASFRLDYLAMGDSYSSGQGDIGKKSDGRSYYLPGTEKKEQCHLSSRSYPFLLRNSWLLSADNMKSVACSGARVLPDFYGNPDNYYGQAGRLAGLSESDLVAAKHIALDQFVPGHIPQLEFIKKYHPKMITFTAGGNDVGFPDIIYYCASSYRLLGFIPTDETCAYAKDPEMYSSLMSLIEDQYVYNKQLIEKIKLASPDTQIYLVSYPHFIARALACYDNSAILDRFEINMIRGGVEHFNTILKTVAHDTDTNYVDIENSLNGGQICQGSKYMTGPLRALIQNHDFKDPNMYHPNAEGHKQIASTIENSIGSNTSLVPSDAGYEPTLHIYDIIQQLVMPSFAPINSSQTLQAPANTFKPGSKVTIAMYSQKTDLGSTTTHPDGSLHTTIAIPRQVGIGHHLLTLTGVDSNDNAIQLQQFVYITSGIPSDIDGDGIKDEDDVCDAITEWYQDGENICSASDAAAYSPVFATANTKSYQASAALSSNSDVVPDTYFASTNPYVIPSSTPHNGTSKLPTNISKQNYSYIWWFIAIAAILWVVIYYYAKKYSKEKAQ